MNAGRTRSRVALVLGCAVSLSLGDVTRPRDPWVFRCELEGRPRTLVVALQTELWLAYDTESCALIRATRGDPLAGSKAWSTDSGVGAWWLVRDGHAISLAVHYLGFDLRDGHAALHFELLGPDGARIEIDETPEFVRAGELGDDPATIAPWLTTGKFGLRRTFQARGVPTGAQLSFTLSSSLRHPIGNFLADNLRDFDERSAAPQTTRLTGRLPFEGAVSSNEILLFFEPATSTDAKR